MESSSKFQLNRRIATGIASTVALMTATFILFGQGCGKMMSGGVGSGSLLSNIDQCEGAPVKVIDKTYEVIPGKRTASIAYGEQLLASLVACTGIEAPSQRTIDEWTRRNQSLSEYGHLADVSGAMMMAVAAVAAEVCRDLIDRERGLASVDRNIFRSVNFNGNGLGAAEINESADMLGISCWQRLPSDNEKMMIQNAINELNTNSQNGALSLCTSMLASLSAIEQ